MHKTLHCEKGACKNFFLELLHIILLKIPRFSNFLRKISKISFCTYIHWRICTSIIHCWICYELFHEIFLTFWIFSNNLLIQSEEKVLSCPFITVYCTVIKDHAWQIFYPRLFFPAKILSRPLLFKQKQYLSCSGEIFGIRRKKFFSLLVECRRDKRL
jgi:hypothetical protein